MAGSCAACGRPVAAARPTCLYCGAALIGEALEAATAAAASDAEPESPPPAEPESQRVLVVGVLADADPQKLMERLGGSLLEARQRVQRPGPELLRIRAAEGAEEEAEALARCGARVRLLSEAAVRRYAEPWQALGGRRDSDDGLRLRSAREERRVAPGSVLLVVQGRIHREYQPRVSKRPRTATLEQGHRIHLHLRDPQRPVELDPGGFEFDAESGPGSSLLRLRGWVERLASDVATDDRFRFLPPALGPEEPTAEGVLAATRGLHRGSGRATPGAAGVGRRGGDESQILDNLRQFRFYSAWRGAWERAEAG